MAFFCKPILRYLVLTALLPLFLLACSSAPIQPTAISRGDYQSTQAYLTKLVEYEMKKNNIIGLSIALVDDQKIVWAQGFGYADLEMKLLATPETVYRVGSVSKLFNATVAMQLAEQGKLDIDKPLQTYIPEFSIKSRFPDAGPITPRNIMTHHSGLPGNRVQGMWTAAPGPFTTLAGSLKDDYVAYPPNYILAYSNLGVTLLGHALQNVSGTDYADLMQQSLLVPLGMQNSAFAQAAQGALMSKGYKNGKETEEVPLRDVPAGGLNSNVVDMGRFIQMVLAKGVSNGKTIIKPETLDTMLQQQNKDVALDLDTRIGLGWFLSNRISGGGMMAEHGGATMLHRAQLAVLPEHKLGVVVLSNSASAEKSTITISDAALKMALEVKTGIQQSKELSFAPNSSPLEKLDLNRYVGFYHTHFGFVSISNGGDRLFADIGGNKTELIPVGDGKARLQYKLFGLIPLPIEYLKHITLSRSNVSGHEIVVFNKNNEQFLAGVKLHAVPLSEIWLNRVGEYKILNSDNGPFQPQKISITVKNGFLSVLFNDAIAMTLTPVTDSEAVTSGLGRSKQETIRVIKTDGEEQINFLGYILKKTASIKTKI